MAAGLTGAATRGRSQDRRRHWTGVHHRPFAPAAAAHVNQNVKHTDRYHVNSDPEHPQRTRCHPNPAYEYLKQTAAHVCSQKPKVAKDPRSRPLPTENIHAPFHNNKHTSTSGQSSFASIISIANAKINEYTFITYPKKSVRTPKKFNIFNTDNTIIAKEPMNESPLTLQLFSRTKPPSALAPAEAFRPASLLACWAAIIFN